MVDTKELLELKDALTKAIQTSKRLDKCHATYRARTQSGFSRAITTTYNANASSLSSALKSELETAKQAAINAFNI